MPWIPFIKTKKWYQYWTLWIAVALLMFALLFGARIKRRYDRWDARRSAERAKDYFEKGDYKHAMLDARRTLEVFPGDADATRVFAKSVEAVGAPGAAHWRNRLDSITPGDVENIFAWVKDAIQEGDWSTADRVLNTLKPEDRNDARYHDLAAKIAMSRRETASAETHWAEASRLDPTEERYRLSLAVLRLESKVPGTREGALGVLRDLAAKTPKTIGALRALIADAIRHGEYATAKETAETLVAQPGALFSDKLIRLSVLRSLNEKDATSYLIELRDAALAKPADLAQLLVWMNTHSLSMMVDEWLPGLPHDVVSKPPVCVVIAESYAKAGEWGKLRGAVEKGDWQALDYMRRAFLARTLERLGDADGGAREWKEALAAASSSPDALQRLQGLAKAAAEWGWKDRREEVLWKMTGYFGCPRWAIDTLWTSALRRGESAQLQTLSRILAKSRPKDFGLRNNYIFLSLLTRTEEGNPLQAAEELYNEHRDNPIVVSTYALALYQKGRPAEAVSAMAALKPEDLRDPQVAIYYGIMLTAAGQTAKAEEYLRLGADWPLLPEEKALLARVKLAASKNAESSGREASSAPKPRGNP